MSLGDPRNMPYMGNAANQELMNGGSTPVSPEKDPLLDGDLSNGELVAPRSTSSGTKRPPTGTSRPTGTRSTGSG